MDDKEVIAVKAENIYYTKNPNSGLLEARDLITNEVVAFQETLDDFALAKTAMIQIELPDGSKVLMQRGISRTKVLESLKSKQRYDFSQTVSEIIVEQMLGGKTLTSICSQAGYPSYAQICRWRNENKEFAKAIENARQFRAEYFHDKLIEEHEDIGDVLEKEEVAAKTLKIANLKWLTERNDTGRYGGKQKEAVAATGGGTIKIVVNTGITRDTNNNDIIEITNED